MDTAGVTDSHKPKRQSNNNSKHDAKRAGREGLIPIVSDNA